MQFITILAGHNFRPTECKAALAEVKMGHAHRLELERDPENAYDPNAVKVMLTLDDQTEDPYFIGFVAGPDAQYIAPYLDADESVRENSGNPLWTEDHVPSVERCEIIDWVSGDKKPTIVIEISTGFELGTLVRGPDDEDEDGDTDFLSGEEDEEGEVD